MEAPVQDKVVHYFCVHFSIVTSYCNDQEASLFYKVEFCSCHDLDEIYTWTLTAGQA